MSDLARMKRSRSGSVPVPVTNASAVAVPYNENRVSLILPGSATQTVTWRYGNVATGTAGLFIPIAGAPIRLSLLLDGALVKGPWACIAGTGAETLVYHESSNSEP